MRYLSHTPEDVKEMLDAIGAKSVEDLFASIPANVRRDKPIDIPAMSEWALSAELSKMASENFTGTAFMGAGCYPHAIPAHIPYLASRSEFVTSYTPYQPEVSQGTLQAIFEFQTMTANLLGMEVANASMYDGANSVAEGAMMAIRVKKKPKVAYSRLLHPHYVQEVKTYLKPAGFDAVEIPAGPDGRTDLSKIPDDVSAVIVQSPNFAGVIEDLDAASKAAHDKGALFFATFTEAMAWGLLKNPGSCGADMAGGEGRSFGLPLNAGGPGLGMLACTMKNVRSMPGRLIGQTVDRNGERCFVLTLAAREQHIRREKATSNICTNSGHCALTASMYMASAGREGLRAIAKLNHDKAAYLKAGLEKVGFKPLFDAPFFNEFAMKAPSGFDKAYDKLIGKGFAAGVPMGRFLPEYDGAWLFCATEVHTREVMDAFLKEVA